MQFIIDPAISRQNYERPLMVVFRRKGEKIETEFRGSIFVLGEDQQSLAHVDRRSVSDPLLLNCPVITIGGKKQYQSAKVREFLAGNPGFQGVFFLKPGNGQYDMDEGDIIAMNPEVLTGKKVSGGRPEVQLTNYRWLNDGRWVADRAKMLHGKKVLETLETELEQKSSKEGIANRLLFWTEKSPVAVKAQEVVKTLQQLENRRAGLIKNENPRNMEELVKEVLIRKLQEASVARLYEIPENFSISVEEVDAELVSQQETLGKVEIPGLGLHPGKRGQIGRVQVSLTIEEVKRVKYLPSGIELEVRNSPQSSAIVEGLNSDHNSWSEIRARIDIAWKRRQVLFAGEQQPIKNLAESPAPVVCGESLDGEPVHAFAGVRYIGPDLYTFWFDSAAAAEESIKKNVR